jgi:bacteriorhodopsin
MEISKQIQGLNAGLLGLFSAYLIGRGDVGVEVIAIPAISTSKYVLLSNTKGSDTQWTHYLSWFLTTPIMLYLIFSLNNMPFNRMAVLIAMNQLMIAAGYMAEGKDPWFWFIGGCFAFLPILYELAILEKGIPLIVLTLVTWSLYPIVWALFHKKLITWSSRNISYSFLDFTSKAGLVTLYLIEKGLLPRL